MLSSSLFSDAKPSEPGTIAILWITVESYDTDTSSAFIEEIILKAGILIQRFLEISSSAFPGKEFLLSPKEAYAYDRYIPIPNSRVLA